MSSGIKSDASGTFGALTFGGDDAITFDATGIQAGSYKAGSIDSAALADGALIENAPACLGYGPGAGGTVTQATSKSTEVTLNKPCGRITTHNAALAAGAQVTFKLNNSLIATSDIVKVTTYDLGNAAPDAYEVRARTAAGIAVITIRNSGGASYSENIGILFQIHKGATS